MPEVRSVLMVHPGAELFGSDRVFLEAATGLARAGFEVTVALPASGPLSAELGSRGIHVVTCPMFVLRKSSTRFRGVVALLGLALRGLVHSFKLFRRVRPETVYISTVVLPQWPLISRLLGATVVVHIHEAATELRPLARRVVYFPAWAAHRIVANSDFTSDTVTAIYPSMAPRIVTIHNAVPGPETFSPPRPRLDNLLRIVYVGRISPRKGPDVVVEAVRLLRERGCQIEVNIVGSVFPGYEWYLTRLDDAISTGRLEGLVHVSGFAYDVWPHLAASDVVVVPSRLDESFGNAAVEGMLAGRPVIISDLPGLREATEGRSSVVRCQPDSGNSLATALLETIAHWPTLRAAAIVERASVRESMSVERFSRDLVAVMASHPLGGTGSPSQDGR